LTWVDSLAARYSILRHCRFEPHLTFGPLFKMHIKIVCRFVNGYSTVPKWVRLWLCTSANSQAFSSSGRGAMTQCGGARSLQQQLQNQPVAWCVDCEDCGSRERRERREHRDGDREGRVRLLRLRWVRWG
jgi:hypothetical protein